MILALGPRTLPQGLEKHLWRGGILQIPALGFQGLSLQRPGTAGCLVSSKRKEVFRSLQTSRGVLSVVQFINGRLTHLMKQIFYMVFISTELCCGSFSQGQFGSKSGEMWSALFFFFFFLSFCHFLDRFRGIWRFPG